MRIDDLITPVRLLWVEDTHFKGYMLDKKDRSKK
jgi:hypothetical protein